MQCPECEALPEIDYPEADLYFWLPLAHTHSKIAALLEDSNLQFEDLGHQALRVSIHDADMRPFLLRVRGALTGQELSNANDMALPRGEEPGPSNFSKVISLSKLIGLSSGKWLRGLVFGTLEPLSDLDQKVAFGDIQLSYENEPFQSMMKQLAAEGTSLAGMEKVPGLAELSPWTRAEAARLLAAGGQVMCFAGETAAKIRASLICRGSGAWTRIPWMASSTLSSAISCSNSASDASSASTVVSESMPSRRLVFSFMPT